MAEPPKSKAYLTAKNRFWQYGHCARRKVLGAVVKMAAGGVNDFQKCWGEKYFAPP